MEGLKPTELTSDLLTREQALVSLGVQKATLYTYVSRGWIRSVAQKGTRSRLFSAEDIDRLRGRSAVHRGNAPRGASALRWGEPVLSSALTQLTADGPFYRGHAAIQLASSGVRFENVAQLLWTGKLCTAPLLWAVRLDGKMKPPSSVEDMLRLVALALLRRCGDDDFLSPPEVLLRCATSMCGTDEADKAGVEHTGIAEAIGTAFGGEIANDKTVRMLNAALVLCADFELAPATFAARIAASAGVNLASCVLTGITTHTGSHVAGAVREVQEFLFHDSSDEGIDAKLRQAQTSGARRFGFNHPLFPNGDPRARALIELTMRADPHAPIDPALRLLDRGHAQFGLQPGIAIALTLLCRALRLCPLAPLVVWTLGRTAGLIAHVREQREAGFKIRPRAEYSPSANS